ncbi:DUF747-domain-containing protein [Suhomyces tanzawaensis NRRL Y-17324]|uniref:DUF747-domain-containing protein n=1 Tax=Suhomyces tanzawaensis NRRL Y-17324 TaxID=984487 RepID=A0A1E4SQP8_9ASCO|nr:DUF747-domain-containing protein [Suhomyces tanzawaensis NRRL Y-17324]ODV81818.1 DUF747-domain-containing protein [Suhomyces tanzawaensis NRRL Y-17324]
MPRQRNSLLGRLEPLQPRASRSRSRSRSRSASTGHSHSTFFNFIIGSTPSLSSYKQPSKNKNRLVSLYRLLLIELNLPVDSLQGPSQPSSSKEASESYDELISMVQIPFYLENFMVFGLLICLNSFLTLFTVTPLKIFITCVAGVKKLVSTGTARTTFAPVKKDFVTVSIIVCSLVVLSSPRLDISKMYHDIRGLAHIKLYVMFGVLEVADKLCSSLGQNFLNILHEIPLTDSSASQRLKLVFFFAVSVLYLSFHGYILIYQTISLNVAANSYSNALLALLLSNQFAELKSSVFKKFEREGLFQITMSDLCERFQLSIMLSIITLRNFLQLGQIGLIPNSWKSWNTWLGSIFGPGVIVIGSEIFVDWLKHSYIAKFNKIRPRIYRNFLYVLSLDYLTVLNFDNSTGSDYVVLTKRIGLPLLATIVCFLRMTLTDFKQLLIFPYSMAATTGIVLVTFATLVLVRLILGLVILKLANKIKLEHREYQDSLRGMRLDPFQELAKGLEAPQPFGSPTPVRFPVAGDEQDLPPQSTLTLTLPITGDETPDVSSVPESPRSPIDLSFLPGIPNTEPSSINPTTRSYLYDYDEKVPPTVEEKRNQQLLDKLEDDDLGTVMRYEMSSKRIW